MWRQGGKVPHHVYRQRGPEPDRRPWPDGDPPIATFLNPEDAELAVRAVNAMEEAEGTDDFRAGYDYGSTEQLLNGSP